MVSKVCMVFFLFLAIDATSSFLSYIQTLLFLQDVQIVSTDENQVFLALQEWHQSDTYNLYQSDPQGVYYSIVLENVRSTKQPEENVLIDILEVKTERNSQSVCDITMNHFSKGWTYTLNRVARDQSLYWQFDLSNLLSFFSEKQEWWHKTGNYVKFCFIK